MRSEKPSDDSRKRLYFLREKLVKKQKEGQGGELRLDSRLPFLVTSGAHNVTVPSLVDFLSIVWAPTPIEAPTFSRKGNSKRSQSERGMSFEAKMALQRSVQGFRSLST